MCLLVAAASAGAGEVLGHGAGATEGQEDREIIDGDDGDDRETEQGEESKIAQRLKPWDWLSDSKGVKWMLSSSASANVVFAALERERSNAMMAAAAALQHGHQVRPRTTETIPMQTEV